MEQEAIMMEQKEAAGVLAVGTPAPNFRLASAQGPEVVLEDYRGRHNVVLWFSLGLSCPFCRRYMTQLRLGYSEIQKRGAEILQVTHSTPEEARLYFQQYQLLFPYLCDPERAVYQLYGISIVPGSLFEAIRTAAVGITAVVSDRIFHGEKTPSHMPLMKRYGSTHIEQQAVFILDKSGIIRYVHASNPLGGLPSNAEYLRQLDKLQ
jgi:peroxiredoxin